MTILDEDDELVRAAFQAAADRFFAAPTEDVWRAQPKQALATELAGQVDDLLYGGAAGGGKTEWLIEYVAAQMERYPGNKGVIFRRVFPSLTRTIVDRAKTKLWTRAQWNGQTHTFTFPNRSVLELASLQYADSVRDHQGAEYGVVAFEEITEFLQEQVEFIITRLRSTIPGVKPHLVATTNPGGVGHRWVKRWWVRPLPEDIEPGEQPPTPYEKWCPAATLDKPRPRSRVFVPATLKDNPALTTADPGYIDRIRSMSNRGLRLALEVGDWDAIDAVEGALWLAEDLDGGRIRPELLEYTIGVNRRAIAVDTSDGEDDGDAYGVSHSALGMDGVGYVLGSWGWHASPRMLAKKTVALYHEVGADVLIIEKNHGGKWVPEVMRHEDPNINIKLVWASDGKRTRAEPVAALFERRPDRLLKYAARMAMPPGSNLEAELVDTSFEPGAVSPNELDAMVWALTELCLGYRTKESSRTMPDERLRGRR